MGDSTSSDTRTPTVLVLGAGINGCAIARELVLNGVSVALVDRADAAFGTTAYSSRLIHGGLRYLEYRELDLVRESLAERTRLLRLAPQFVKPLELHIPVENRVGGAVATAARFLRLPFSVPSRRTRGLWLVQSGLKLYDAYARDPSLPKHQTRRLGQAGTLPVNANRFHWLCSYFDAQIRYPERFVLALIEDTFAAAQSNGVQFRVFLHHEAQLQGKTARVRSIHRGEEFELQPDLIVNATGAWVDETLARLHIPSPTLMGGTKGSHILVTNERLRGVLGDQGLYAEAADGRPVFVLPFGTTTLIGTTDERFTGHPEDAVATTAEVEYLIQTAAGLFPDVRLTTADIDMSYSGVRPLPAVRTNSTSAITRRHWLEENRDARVPLFSVIGGKLTTCRSLAEEAMRPFLARLGRTVIANSRDRLLPGAENYPGTPGDLTARIAALAAQYQITREQVTAIWELCGTITEQALAECTGLDAGSLPGTNLPRAFVRWHLTHALGRSPIAWSGTLADLVERRLMLIYHPHLQESCLHELANMLVEQGTLQPADAADAVTRYATRLRTHFGKRLVPRGQE